jgi:hypothetical protein
MRFSFSDTFEIKDNQMAGKYLLRNWSVIVPDRGAYTAPECAGPPCLQGFRRSEGQDQSEEQAVMTSYIVACNGKEIITYSGSLYTLEEPAPEYLIWMQENSFTYDPTQPVRFKTKADKSLN